MRTHKRYSREVKERSVRMVLDHEGEYDSQWSAIVSISSKIGCSPETLRRWVRRAEIDSGEREVRELRRANEILRKASAFFAQAELDRPPR